MGQPAVFLDRDGTINQEVDYLRRWEDFVFLPRTMAGLHRWQSLGYALVVLTNQSGVARGYLDWPTLETIHQNMRQRLSAEGIRLAGIYVCPHGPRDGCDCRKPLPGLAYRAIGELGLTLERSWMIGDKLTDLQMGRALGIRTILVRTGYGANYTESDYDGLADEVAEDLWEAAIRVEQILQDCRSPHDTAVMQARASSRPTPPSGRNSRRSDKFRWDGRA